VLPKWQWWAIGIAIAAMMAFAAWSSTNSYWHAYFTGQCEGPNPKYDHCHGRH
jgi:hypothetical protein